MAAKGFGLFLSTAAKGCGGGSDDFLFNGPKVTPHIEAEMLFGIIREKFPHFNNWLERFESLRV